MVEVGSTYRHFKGGVYQVICIAKDSETLEDMVVYENVENHKIWVRSYENFTSKVDLHKYPNEKQEYRFMKVK